MVQMVAAHPSRQFILKTMRYKQPYVARDTMGRPYIRRSKAGKAKKAMPKTPRGVIRRIYGVPATKVRSAFSSYPQVDMVQDPETGDVFVPRYFPKSQTPASATRAYFEYRARVRDLRSNKKPKGITNFKPLNNLLGVFGLA